MGTLLTLLLGAKSIEKSNKIKMPLFYLIFLVLAVRVAMLPEAAEGYKFMFMPRWEELKNPMVWIWSKYGAYCKVGTMDGYRIDLHLLCCVALFMKVAF